MTMNDKKMFGARIDLKLVKQVKHISVDTEKTVAMLMEEALVDLIKKYEKIKTKG